MNENVKLLYDVGDEVYVADVGFENRHIPKGAGFRWDPRKRRWWTKDPATACKLRQYAEPTVAAELEKHARKVEAAIAASKAAAADVDIPRPEGLEYLPFQRAGIAYAMDRPSVLIADQMGLGKTIQAIGIINADANVRRVLIICPASLRLNWQREAEKWLVRAMTVGVVDTKAGWVDSDVVVINYDILHRFRSEIDAVQWDLLVVDECHYCKNSRAKRTQMVLGKWDRDPAKRIEPIQARRRVFLTGTPITNRPIEIWPVAHALDPVTFNSMMGFAKRYCGAYQGRYGWDFSGATNLDELQEKLRSSIMVRRLKADVLTELPAKRRQVIEVPANGAAEQVRAEREAWDRHESEIDRLRAEVELAKASASEDEYQKAVDRLCEGQAAAFGEMATLRHDTAMAKVPSVLAHLLDAVDASGKVVVFAHHKDVVRAIEEGLSQDGIRSVKLVGDTSMVERQAAVDAFQGDPNVRVFIGSITAAGVGITLTASSHVVFAELDWVPGNLTQAEDRCHRIGQRESVLVQHLVFDGSLDARMAKILVRKQEIIDKALDIEPEEKELAVKVMEFSPVESTPRKQIEKVAETLTAEQIEAIHDGLRTLASYCDGARALDGWGFSKVDAHIGKSLADCPRLTPKQAALGQRLVRKYRRQLGQEVLGAAGV